MSLHEPFTFASDLLLAIVAGGLGARLLRRAGASREPHARGTRAWGWALLLTGCGALTGGIWHAVAPEIPPWAATILWKSTLVTIGAASALMLTATAFAHLGAPGRRLLVGLALVELAVYLVWIAGHDDFLFVIYDYGSAMLAVLAVHLWAAARHRPGAGRIAAAVLLSLAAAAIQQSPLALGPLDHNVLYHLVQLAALVLFFVGALALEVRASAVD